MTDAMPHDMMPTPQGESAMGAKTVLILGEVVREQGEVLTIKLDDGFGNVEVVVHKDKTTA